MLNAAQAEEIIRKSRNWGERASLEFLVYSGRNESCYFFMAYYGNSGTDQVKSVPLGVSRITKKIINCTIDDD